MNHLRFKWFHVGWVVAALLLMSGFQNCQRSFETDQFSSDRDESNLALSPQDMQILSKALEVLQTEDQLLSFEASGDKSVGDLKRQDQYVVLMEDKSDNSCRGKAINVSIGNEVLSKDSDPVALGIHDSDGTCWASLFEVPDHGSNTSSEKYSYKSFYQPSDSKLVTYEAQDGVQDLPRLSGVSGGRIIMIPFRKVVQSPPTEEQPTTNQPSRQPASDEPPKQDPPKQGPASSTEQIEQTPTQSGSNESGPAPSTSSACSFGSKGPDVVISGQTIDLRKSGSKRIGEGLSINGRRILIENNKFIGRSENSSNSCSIYMIDPSKVDVVIIRNNSVDMTGESPCVIEGNTRGVVFFAGWMPAHTALNKKICIENNTFKSMPKGMKMIETKTSGVVVKGNRGDGQINLRHGRNVLLENNDTTADINVMGAGHVIRGNKGQIVLHQGNVTQSQIENKDAGGGSQYPFAERIKIDRSQKIKTTCWLSSCQYWPTDENGKKFQF